MARRAVRDLAHGDRAGVVVVGLGRGGEKFRRPRCADADLVHETQICGRVRGSCQPRDETLTRKAYMNCTNVAPASGLVGNIRKTRSCHLIPLELREATRPLAVRAPTRSLATPARYAAPGRSERERLRAARVVHKEATAGGVRGRHDRHEIASSREERRALARDQALWCDAVHERAVQRRVAVHVRRHPHDCRWCSW